MAEPDSHGNTICSPRRRTMPDIPGAAPAVQGTPPPEARIPYPNSKHRPVSPAAVLLRSPVAPARRREGEVGREAGGGWMSGRASPPFATTDPRQDARTCTRCGTHPPVEGGTVCEPCRVARRDRERKQYAARRIAGSPAACAAGAARPRPVMPRIATGAPGAGPNAQEKWRKMQGADSVIPGGAPGGFASIVPHRPRARPGVLRAPAGPGRVRASIAGCRFCHLELLSSRSPPARIMGHGTGGKM